MRGWLFLSLFTTFASFVLLVFVVLTGSTTGGPFDVMYWSQIKVPGNANIEGIRWTNYGACGISSDNKNVDCTTKKFAYEFDPTVIPDFGTLQDKKLSDKKGQYKGMSRAAYILLLVALILSVLSIPLVLLSFFCPIGFLTGISEFFVFVSFLLSIVGAAMETYLHVYAVKQYKASGYSANIGSVVFGIVWGAVAGLLLSLIFIILARLERMREKRGGGVAHHHEEEKCYSDTD